MKRDLVLKALALGSSIMLVCVFLVHQTTGYVPFVKRAVAVKPPPVVVAPSSKDLILTPPSFPELPFQMSTTWSSSKHLSVALDPQVFFDTDAEATPMEAKEESGAIIIP